MSPEKVPTQRFVLSAKINFIPHFFFRILTVTQNKKQPSDGRRFQIKATITLPLSLCKLISLRNFPVYYAILYSHSENRDGLLLQFVSITKHIRYQLKCHRMAKSQTKELNFIHIITNSTTSNKNNENCGVLPPCFPHDLRRHVQTLKQLHVCY